MRGRSGSGSGSGRVTGSVGSLSHVQSSMCLLAWIPSPSLAQHLPLALPLPRTSWLLLDLRWQNVSRISAKSVSSATMAQGGGWDGKGTVNNIIAVAALWLQAIA